MMRLCSMRPLYILTASSYERVLNGPLPPPATLRYWGLTLPGSHSSRVQQAALAPYLTALTPFAVSSSNHRRWRVQYALPFSTRTRATEVHQDTAHIGGRCALAAGGARMYNWRSFFQQRLHILPGSPLKLVL